MLDFEKYLQVGEKARQLVLDLGHKTILNVYESFALIKYFVHNIVS